MTLKMISVSLDLTPLEQAVNRKLLRRTQRKEQRIRIYKTGLNGTLKQATAMTHLPVIDNNVSLPYVVSNKSVTLAYYNFIYGVSHPKRPPLQIY